MGNIQVYGPERFLKQIESGLELLATYRPNFYTLIQQHLKIIFFLGHMNHPQLEKKPNQILPGMNILVISHQFHLQCSSIEMATLLIYETFLCLYSKKYVSRDFNEIENSALKISLHLSLIFNQKTQDIASFIQNYG